MFMDLIHVYICTCTTIHVYGKCSNLALVRKICESLLYVLYHVFAYQMDRSLCGISDFSKSLLLALNQHISDCLFVVFFPCLVNLRGLSY